MRNEIFFLSPSDLAASPTRCRARRTRPKAAQSPRASARDPGGDFLPRGGAERPPTAGRGAADARAFSTPRAAWQRRPLAASRADEGRRTAPRLSAPAPDPGGPARRLSAPARGLGPGLERPRPALPCHAQRGSLVLVRDSRAAGGRCSALVRCGRSALACSPCHTARRSLGVSPHSSAERETCSASTRSVAALLLRRRLLRRHTRENGVHWFSSSNTV